MNSSLPNQAGQPNASVVTFQTCQSVEMRGTLLRLGRHQIAFEVYHLPEVLRVSEVLDHFTILVNNELIYSGKAVVSNLVSSGPSLVCEARLDDVWVDLDRLCSSLSEAGMNTGFDGFFRQWQNHFSIGHEFRLFVTELQSFPHDLRLWSEHLELGIRSRPSAGGQRPEPEITRQLGQKTLAIFQDYVERFETLCGGLPPEVVPAHQAYIRRQIHPLILCAPFVYRTYSKPLGYAGDYEVVNMIMRDPFEGASIFAKIINYCFLAQKVSIAHQNRIDYLVQQLVAEGLRVRRAGRELRVMSLGCGPAVEVQRFMAQDSLASNATIELLDFNEETLQYARKAVAAASQRHSVLSPTVRLTKKGVHQIVKEASRATQVQPGARYDFIYCAGLFDYLTDQVCRRLMDVMFSWLAPDGLLVVTNVDPSNPLRHGMEHLLDWNLVYRTSAQLAALVPALDVEESAVRSDLTGVNVLAEVRKSPHG
jgi:extracellular factor (EF) 3-hydroxypalmitic acid methyl ester biosynthesis protein